jgi:hypothetical protein
LVAGIHLPSKRGAVKFWFLTIGDRARNPRPIQQSRNLFRPYCRGDLGNINGIWREFPVSETRLFVGFWRKIEPLIIPPTDVQTEFASIQAILQDSWGGHVDLLQRHQGVLICEVFQAIRHIFAGQIVSF